jgi:replicative DNA helicase
MPVFDSTARKQAPAELTFRTAPHNIEAEQALLGAILVNNEAFYRISDFLEPKHFFEPIHQRIFELASGLVRAGKLATPVTLKTFLPADFDIAGLSVNQYLARLAAEATTIINAEDYGRTVYDLSIRRDLIAIGEDMVNLAFDAPVDATPQAHIEDAERKLYELAETGRYETGFQRFAQALTTAVDMAARAYQRDGSLSGLASGLTDLNSRMGGAAALRPGHPCRPPRHGQHRACHEHRLQCRQGVVGRGPRRRAHGNRQRRHRRLLLAGNVGRAARHPHHLRADRNSVKQDPPRRH